MKMKTKRIMKRAVPIVMAVIMILGVIGSALSSMVTVQALTVNPSKYSSLGMSAVTARQLRAGDTDRRVTLTFTNHDRRDIKVTDFGMSCDNSFIEVHEYSTQDFTIEANGNHKVSFMIDIESNIDSDDIEGAVVSVFMHCSNSYDDDEDVEKTISLSNIDVETPAPNVTVKPGYSDGGYTEIEGSIAKPRMDIKVSSTTPTSCKEGDTIDVIVLLTYYNSAVSIQGSTISVEGENFSVINGMVSRNLRYESYKYSGKESYTKAVRYQMQAKKDLVSGYYPVKISVKYYDDEETTEYTAENSFNIYIEGSKKSETDEDDKKTDIAKPYLIVEQYEYKSETGNDYIMAGETFSLKLSIKNTSNILPVENILVTLTEPEQFTLTSSSNTIYMDRLGAGGSIEKEINVRAKSNAPAGSHAIKLDFTYQYIDDEVRKDGTSTENIAIPIIQRDRFEVGEIEPPMMMYVGEESGIELTFVNKGTTEVRNITAVINGNIQNPGQSQYVGNLPAGEESSVNFAFSALEPGTVKAFVTLSYEDSNDIQREVVKEFTVEAQEMPKFDDMGMGGMDPGMMEPMEQESHMPVWGWIAIVVGGAAVVVVIIIIIRKKRKAKKAQEDDDEDI